MRNIEKYMDQGIGILFRIIIYGVLCFFVVGFLTFPSERQPDIYQCQKLDIDWYQIMDDGTKKLITVPGNCEVKAGEKLRIMGTLPMTLDTDVMPWLCFHSSLQDMEIYIDGEMRGAYTTKETRLWGANSVSANYFVKLLPSDKGKTIDFFSVTDSNYSGVLSEIYGGTVFGIYAQFVKNNIFETISALMILILSIVTIIISEYLRIKQHTGIYLAYLGWTELLLSI